MALGSRENIEETLENNVLQQVVVRAVAAINQGGAASAPGELQPYATQLVSQHLGVMIPQPMDAAQIIQAVVSRVIPRAIEQAQRILGYGPVPPGTTPIAAPPPPSMQPIGGGAGAPSFTPVSPPAAGARRAGPSPPGMPPIGAPPAPYTPPRTSPAQLAAAASTPQAARQPMLTPSAPIPVMQQAQALMSGPVFTPPPPSNVKKKMIIGAVAGLAVAGMVVAVLTLTGGGEDAGAADQTAAAQPDAATKPSVKPDGPAGAGKTDGDGAKTAPAKTTKPAAKPPTPAVASTWNGRSTFTCRDQQVHVLRDVKANTGGRIAILTRGKCTVYCVSCDITSKNRYAVRSHNGSKIVLVGGTVTGRKYALYAVHHSTIVHAGTDLRGRKKTLGRARVLEKSKQDVEVP